jgi:hypothetical protein
MKVWYNICLVVHNAKIESPADRDYKEVIAKVKTKGLASLISKDLKEYYHENTIYTIVIE